MRNFTYHNPVRILFGDHALDQLPDLFREFHVSNLLLVYSGDFIKELGIWDAVRKACVQSGIAFYEEGGVVPNPKIELVRELITLGKEKRLISYLPWVEAARSIQQRQWQQEYPMSMMYGTSSNMLLFLKRLYRLVLSPPYLRAAPSAPIVPSFPMGCTNAALSTIASSQNSPS